LHKEQIITQDCEQRRLVVRTHAIHSICSWPKPFCCRKDREVDKDGLLVQRCVRR